MQDFSFTAGHIVIPFLILKSRLYFPLRKRLTAFFKYEEHLSFVLPPHTLLSLLNYCLTKLSICRPILQAFPYISPLQVEIIGLEGTLSVSKSRFVASLSRTSITFLFLLPLISVLYLCCRLFGEQALSLPVHVLLIQWGTGLCRRVYARCYVTVHSVGRH